MNFIYIYDYENTIFLNYILFLFNLFSLIAFDQLDYNHIRFPLFYANIKTFIE